MKREREETRAMCLRPKDGSFKVALVFRTVKPYLWGLTCNIYINESFFQEGVLEVFPGSGVFIGSCVCGGGGGDIIALICLLHLWSCLERNGKLFKFRSKAPCDAATLGLFDSRQPVRPCYSVRMSCCHSLSLFQVHLKLSK